MHRRALTVSGLVLLAGCNKVGFDAVTVYPTHGWVDGCTDIKIGGTGFGDDVAATVGGKPLENTSIPAKDDTNNYGYQLFGRTPQADAKGFATVEVTNGGEKVTLKDAFYYVECFGSPYPEAALPSDGITTGSTVTIYGCNLDASAYHVEVRDPSGVATSQTATLTSDCRTGIVSFTAPSMPAGDHQLYFVDSNGAQIWPPVCTDTDTSDTADPCIDPITLNFAG
jgi:hypothetical protein